MQVVGDPRFYDHRYALHIAAAILGLLLSTAHYPTWSLPCIVAGWVDSHGMAVS